MRPISEEAHTELVLTAIRGVVSKARMYAIDVEDIGVSLKHGVISPDLAIAWAQDLGALDHMQPAMRKLILKEKE